jgi:hypothetical protein
MSKNTCHEGTPEERRIQREFMERDILVLVQKFCVIRSEPLRRSVISLVCELSDGAEAGDGVAPNDLMELITVFVNLKNDKIRRLIMDVLSEYTLAVDPDPS